MWRTRWNVFPNENGSSRRSFISTASMQGGCRLFEVDFRTHSILDSSDTYRKYEDSESTNHLSYGIDTLGIYKEDVHHRFLHASCSFYEDIIDVWE